MSKFINIFSRYLVNLILKLSGMTIGTLLKKKFEAFDKDCDMATFLNSQTANISYHDMFPANGEYSHFNNDPSHEVEINGTRYSNSDIQKLLEFNRPTTRTHLIKLNVLHRLAKEKFINYIILTDTRFEYFSNDISSSGDLHDFEYYFDLFMNTYSISLKKMYLQYWMDYTTMMLTQMNSSSEISITINKKAIALLTGEITELQNRLNQYR